MPEKRPSANLPTNLPANPTAGLIIIGNEILSGRTRDANISHVACGLTKKGITLAEVRVIPDVAARIIHTVNELRVLYAHVFTTGGIGPTHDDLTVPAIAAAFDLELEENAGALALLVAHYDGAALNDARRAMARMPVGARLIDNPVSRVAGFSIGNVHVLAGVPRIMQAMFDGLLPTLGGGAVVLSRSLSAIVAEGEVAAPLCALQDEFTDIEIGSYPYFENAKFGVSIVLRGVDEARLDLAASKVAAMFNALGAQIDHLDI